MSLKEPGPSIDIIQPPILWPDRPWLAIWFKPRATIRAIVDTDPERYVILLAALSGIPQVLNNASGNGLGDSLSLVSIVLIGLIGGPVAGLFSLYLSGAILRWTGSPLGGQAEAEEVRAAIAWSSIPSIVGLVFWIPLLALHAMETVTSLTSVIEGSPWASMFLGLALLGLSLIELVIAIWGFFLLVKCLSEVHQFSAWRGLGAVVLPALVIIVPLFFCFGITFLSLV